MSLQSGLQEAAEFIARFPIGSVARVTEINSWAAEVGKYPCDVEPATINGSRGNLVKKINRAARSEEWRDKGNEPFCIMVDRPGEKYSVRPVDEAHQRKINRLPDQVKSLILTKQNDVKTLAKAIDITRMSEAVRISIERKEDIIRSAADQFVFTVEQANKQIASIDIRLAEAIKKDPSMLVSAADLKKVLKASGLLPKPDHDDEEEGDGTDA